MSKGHLYIIGCGTGKEQFPPAAHSILDKASVIAGGKSLLERFASEKTEQVIIASDAAKTAKELAERSKTETVAVLASGDSLFHGIGATFRPIMQDGEYTVIPGITTFQYLFAKLGIPWSAVSFFSIHGKKPVPWRRILSSESAIVYCCHELNFARTAKTLIEKYPACASRLAVAGVCLGCEDEKIIRGTLSELSKNQTPGISMLLLPESEDAVFPPLALGLEDENYIHENNMITHPETRAVILSKLRLRPGVMWDIGAGSGSVSIEAAGLCPGLEVYAVEKSSERFLQLQENISAEGLGNVHAEEGDALRIIDSLPAPDIVFAGGGGTSIADIVEKSFSKLNPGGRVVTSSVTLETCAALSSLLMESRKEVVTISVSRSKLLPCSTMMKAENPITIFVYEKEKQECLEK